MELSVFVYSFRIMMKIISTRRVLAMSDLRRRLKRIENGLGRKSDTLIVRIRKFGGKPDVEITIQDGKTINRRLIEPQESKTIKK